MLYFLKHSFYISDFVLCFLTNFDSALAAIEAHSPVIKPKASAVAPLSAFRVAMVVVARAVSSGIPRLIAVDSFSSFEFADKITVTNDKNAIA